MCIRDRLIQDRQQRLPLAGKARAAVVGEGEGDQLAEAAAQGGAEVVHLSGGQRLWRGDAAVEFLDHFGEGAQAGAFLPGGGGVQRGAGGFDGVENARLGGDDQGFALFPRGDFGADLILCLLYTSRCV